MSRERWGLSLLIAYHLSALALSSLPSRDAMQRYEASLSGRRTEAFLPIFFDQVAALAVASERHVLASSGVIRTVTDPYIRAGLRQEWNMFSSPDVEDHYLRVDYLVVGKDGQSRRYQHVVFPEASDRRARWVHSYRDKAISNAFENHAVALEKPGVDGDLAALKELEPVSRYWSSWFRRAVAEREGSLLRTELWYGSVPNPAPGQTLEAPTLERRAAVIASYRMLKAVPSSLVRDRLGAVHREADVAWMLVHAAEAR